MGSTMMEVSAPHLLTLLGTVVAPTILALLAVVVFLLPIMLATRYNRNPLGWFLVGLVASPFLAIIILLFIGEVDNTPQQVQQS